MTIEQQYRELKRSKHLWCLMPKGKYLEIVLQAEAMEAKMRETLAGLEAVVSPRMPAKRPTLTRSERKAKGPIPASAAEIVDPGANLEAASGL